MHKHTRAITPLDLLLLEMSQMSIYSSAIAGEGRVGKRESSPTPAGAWLLARLSCLCLLLGTSEAS